MHLLILAAAALAVAAPTEHQTTFSVSQESLGKRLRNGPQAVADTLRKYGAVVPANILAAAAGSQSGQVVATPEQYDERYTAPVTIGSTKMNLDFDTGSADLWVFSTQQPASQVHGQTRYPCTGVKEAGKSWSITYGDQSGAAGNVFADKVIVGGVTATSFNVEAATSVSAQFTNDPNSDGLLGLGMSNLNMIKPTKGLTFFDTVRKTLKAPLFAAELKHSAPGVYDFGFIDTTKIAPGQNLSYVPVDGSRGYWEFHVTSFAAGRNAPVTPKQTVIADTGTSIILLEDAVVSNYYSHVPGAAYNALDGGYEFPCTATLPNFRVKIGTYTAVVPGKYINYAPVSASTCYGGIQSSASVGINILGDVFLKSQYVVFYNDGTTQKIGFAKQHA